MYAQSLTLSFMPTSRSSFFTYIQPFPAQCLCTYSSTPFVVLASQYHVSIGPKYTTAVRSRISSKLIFASYQVCEILRSRASRGGVCTSSTRILVYSSATPLSTRARTTVGISFSVIAVEAHAVHTWLDREGTLQQE